MTEPDGDCQLSSAFSHISSLSERFETEFNSGEYHVDPAISTFVRGLSHEAKRMASEFETATATSHEKAKHLSSLSQALQNQNDALTEQMELLNRLLRSNDNASDSQSFLSPAKASVRGHRRVFSQHAVEEIKQQQRARRAVLDAWEVDLKEYFSFKGWCDAGFPQNHAFLDALEKAEVQPCLDFGLDNDSTTSAILTNIRRTGAVELEPMKIVDGPSSPCAVCPELPAAYKLSGPSETPLLVCGLVRNRVAAVCELYHYARFLRNQQTNCPPAEHKEIFCRLQQHRYTIAVARLGLSGNEDNGDPKV